MPGPRCGSATGRSVHDVPGPRSPKTQRTSAGQEAAPARQPFSREQEQPHPQRRRRELQTSTPPGPAAARRPGRSETDTATGARSGPRPIGPSACRPDPARQSAAPCVGLVRVAKVRGESVIADVENPACTPLVAPAPLEDQFRVSASPGAEALFSRKRWPERLVVLATNGGRKVVELDPIRLRERNGALH